MARGSTTADQPPKSNKERLDELEAQMTQIEGIADGMAQLGERLENVENEYGSLAEKINVLDEDMRGTMHVLQEQLGDLAAKVNLLMRAIGSAGPSVGEGTKMRVPEPRAYRGARDAKELENFLFDMEQYFRAVRPDSEETKVATATMYLTGDAKLRWRTAQSTLRCKGGQCSIDSWDDLKRELKDQFLPENVEFIARHEGT